MVLANYFTIIHKLNANAEIFSDGRPMCWINRNSQADTDKATIKNCWKACPGVWNLDDVFSTKRGLHMISHKDGRSYLATSLFSAIAPPTRMRPFFCLLSCFYCPSKLPVLLKCIECSSSLFQQLGRWSVPSLVLRLRAWGRGCRRWRSRSLTCAAMFTARARDEHITHAHA